MRGPRSWWRFWVALFSRTEPGATLAALRIAVAITLIYSLMSPLAFGLVDDLFIDQSYGGIRHLLGSWLMRQFGGATPTITWTLYCSSVALTSMLLVGFGGRVVPLLLLQTYGGLVSANMYASGGYDYLFTNALWLLVLADATRTWSVDCRRRTGRWSCADEVSAWPRYLFVFQLVVMYTSTGFRKSSVVWLPTDGYSALYYALMDPSWTRYDLPVAWLYPITQVASAMTVHWEQLTILLLLVFYYRYTRERRGRLRRLFNRFDLRKPWAMIGIGLHISILLLLNVGPFSWISLAYYLSLLSPDELFAGIARARRMGHRVATRLKREPSRA